jgi:TPP-dependent pyruvate/acetoin dehydrogenase alpha subunit
MPDHPLPDAAVAIEWLATMMLIRRFEERAGEMYAKAKVGGFLHLAIGEEATIVGSVRAMRDQDYLISTYRSHGHALVRGTHPDNVMAELFGRVDGVCKGRGGSMHMFDLERRFMGGYGIVGGNLPIAAGFGLASDYLGTTDATLCQFGDGASNQGTFGETLNLAALWRLPVLFVCENNGVAEFTSREEHSNVEHVSSFAAPYGIATKTIDGNDLPTVWAAAREAIETLRRGAGPYLLECMTFRMAGHYVGDSQQYRSREELAEIRERCPIERLKRHLVERGVKAEELDAIGELSKTDVHQAVGRARAAPHPDPATVMDYVYRSPALAAIPG